MILWGMWCIPYNTCIKYFRCFILWSCHQPENEPIPYLHLVVLYRAGTWGRKLLMSQWSRHTSALTLGGCPQVTRDDRAYCCLLSFQHLKWQLQYTKNDLAMAKMLLRFYSFTNIFDILHLTGDGCIFVKIWMTMKHFNFLKRLHIHCGSKLIYRNLWKLRRNYLSTNYWKIYITSLKKLLSHPHVKFFFIDNYAVFSYKVFSFQ